MRRILIVLVFVCAAGNLFVRAQQAPSKPPVAAQPPAKAPVAEASASKAAPAKPPAPFTLSIDSIMRGPRLVGNAPSGIRWAQDSSKIYFSWQKPGEDRPNTYVVNRDGTDLEQLSAEEARQVVAGITGRVDHVRKRLLTAEGGNIVIYDMATNARRLLMKTAAAESNPRWAQSDNAVTFMRDGNLFLMTLDGGGSTPAEVQLTDVVAPAADAAAPAAVGRGAAGGFGGFGGAGIAWLPDNERVIFLAEKDGWMHLYSLDVTAAQPAAKSLTSGKWEVASARLSNDRTKIFFASNEAHPGERHFYTMSVDGGPSTRITTIPGGHDVTVSPDEKSLAVVYSYSTKPPELFVMPLAAGAQPKQVTASPTPDFLSFKWIDPKIVTYKARDGALVYARLYTPEMIGAKRDPKHPAVVFVHGAGYLQFVTKSWPSSYYREHLFHNLLASRGYVVMCPDYRASAGYGRDWRTGIYEHMGGQDLEDSVDAAKFIVATEKVDPKRMGTYGGSYGGVPDVNGDVHDA